jgi:hypothetical protein
VAFSKQLTASTVTRPLLLSIFDFGKYQASHSSWYRRQRGFHGNQTNIQSRIVADTGSSFQQSLQFPYGLANSTLMARQVKLDELKALLAKYTSPEWYAIFQRAKSQLEEGDDRFLNDVLSQLRMRDSTQGAI